MPVDPTPLHQNSGAVPAAVSGTPVVVSLAGADTTADGSTLLAWFVGAVTQQVSTAPSGWVKVGPAPAGQAKLTLFRRGPTQGLVAGESSWSFTAASGTANPLSWVVVEYPGLDADAPEDAVPASVTTTTSGTTSANTSPLTSTYDGLAVSAVGSYMSTGGVSDSWGSHTGGFAEVVEQAANDGTKSVDLSMSVLPVQALGTYGPTVTCSRTLGATDSATSLTVVLNATGARKAADLRMIDGAEHGLVTGNATGGVAGWRILDSTTGSVTVDAAAARSGNYGWLLTGTSAVTNFTLSSGGSLPAGSTALGSRPVFRRCFRFPTLPATDTPFWTVTATTGLTDIVVRYITATGKIGVKIGSGTEQVSDAGITANQWFAVDLRLDLRTTAWTVDWQVDYNAELSDATPGVGQSQAAFTASGISILSTYTVGWTGALTATLHTDDAAASGVPAHYPLGDIRVLPLKVDPAATPAVSGTVGNFGVMTNNGTVTALTAGTLGNARDAVDDIPPDLSGTRDAAGAVTGHATDYLEWPMETYDAAANGMALRGVRVVACVWAAAATAATMRLNAYDGTTVYSLFAEADPNADTAATPVWLAAMVRGSSRKDWTQAQLDALTVRFGAADATPDIMLDCILAEVAVVKAPGLSVIGEVGTLATTAAVDPDSAAVVSATMTTPAEYGGTLRWDGVGGSGSQAVAVSSSYTKTFPSSVDVTGVTLVEVDPDPDPDQPG